MRVVVFTTDDPEIPAGLRASAKVLNGAEFLGIRFDDASPERARAAAERWLARELAAEEARKIRAAGSREKLERRRAERAAEKAVKPVPARRRKPAAAG